MDAKKAGREPSLYKALYKMIGAEFTFFGLLMAVNELVLR